MISGTVVLTLSVEQRAELNREEWRGYIFVAAGSDKFWRIRRSGTLVETWWGRRGSSGQKLVHRFHSEQSAIVHRDEKETEKIRKGYVTEGGTSERAARRSPAAGAAGPSPLRRPAASPARHPVGAGAAVALGRFAGLGRPGKDDEE